jgi:4-amino-4-deoxy-L-arabinose transferase-like glycosyltransferase
VPTSRAALPVTPVRLLAAAAVVIAAGVLVRASNHDESQYVAAIALMRGGWPYVDFAYLQTPLQPLLLAPLAWLPAGWLHLAARSANGLFGFATVAILYLALRRRTKMPSLLAALGALVCTDAFLLASSLARNDALPMMLLAAAIAALLRGLDGRQRRWFALAGLALGLAVSAKINAALPAAGAGLFLLLRFRRIGGAAILAFGAGALAGLLPTLVMALVAPAEFRFDVFTYSLAAPALWWSDLGQAADLDPMHRIAKLIAFAALGASLPALAAAVLDRRRGDDDRLLLDLMIAGGVVAAYLPVPFFTQYLVPLLAPLFARFALALESLDGLLRRRLLVATAIGCVAGLVVAFGVRFSRFDVVDSIRLGRQVEVLAGGGPVVTLSPERIAGGSLRLDPRFAAGPFLYRTHGDLGRLAESRGRAVALDGLAGALDAKPPSVVLVGGEAERRGQVYPDGLDEPLVRWAADRNYRPVNLESGFTALVAPVDRR